MIHARINPEGYEDEYLAHLNTSFGSWGGRDRYEWAFRRTAGGPTSDLMVLEDEGSVLAGSAVSYRRAVLPGVGERLVGIMTGSWTLPAARGRGCFTRAIEESLELCRARGAALLLAFVTEDNASYRRLEAAGSVLFPTEYWVAEPAAARADGAALEELPPDLSALWRLHEGRAGQGLRFTYPDSGAYRGQFLERPSTVAVLTGDAGSAVVERAEDTDRVLALYPESGAGPALVRALMARARAAGRSLFGFTTGGEGANPYRAAGLAPRPGFLTALHAEPDLGAAWQGAGVDLENGDRM